MRYVVDAISNWIFVIAANHDYGPCNREVRVLSRVQTQDDAGADFGGENSVIGAAPNKRQLFLEQVKWTNKFSLKQ